MIIIGVDYHPEFQQLSVDTETGEFSEARVQNPEQAEQFELLDELLVTVVK